MDSMELLAHHHITATTREATLLDADFEEGLDLFLPIILAKYLTSDDDWNNFPFFVYFTAFYSIIYVSVFQICKSILPKIN
jgi:hypothetical protein